MGDYYPFGMVMPGRIWSEADYRYGYQNQEEDEELWRGAVSYKYRIEDPRSSRFFNVDPITKRFPHNAAYAFSENRVIDGIELEGLEVVTIGHGASAFVFKNWGIEFGIAVGSDGVFVYSTTYEGFADDLGINLNALSITIYPDTPSVEAISGPGEYMDLGTVEKGISGGATSVKSGNYEGLNVHVS